MATEEDNFDIDIYGDGGEDYQQEAPGETVKSETLPEQYDHAAEVIQTGLEIAMPKEKNVAIAGDLNTESDKTHINGSAQKIASTDDSAQDPLHLPKRAPQIQGLKRKEGSDDRFVDPGATTALFISELHWWVTDDDIRGWANQSQCEDELDDVTFSEHKVNGKSKG